MESAKDDPGAMRLLVVTRERHADKRYGLAKSLMPVLEALNRRGVAWRYLCQEDAGERGWRWLWRLHSWIVPPLRRVLRGTDVHSLAWGILERLNMGRLAARVAVREGYTHVHCHDPIIAAGLRMALPRRSAIRWGVTEHGFGSYVQAMHEDGFRLGVRVARGLRAREGKVLSAADWVILPTHASARQLARDLCLPGIPGTWRVIHHALPGHEEWSRIAARAALGWGAKERIVLAVGRLVPLKRFDLVIDAFARSVAEDARLVILGDGDPSPLLKRAESLGIGRSVEIRAADDIWPYYAGADLYVSASLTESFGMANLEAISCGLAAVCTAAGGVVEVVGDAAVTVGVDDGDALAGAMAALLRDTPQRRRLGEAGRQRGARWMSPEQVADAYLELYAPGSVCRPEAGTDDTRGDDRSRHEGAAESDRGFLAPKLLELPEGLRVLVLAPHPDDETLGCGATIARLVARGAHVAVVIVSDGGKGDPEGRWGDVVQVRKSEAECATRILGVTDLRFLGLPDGELVCNRELEERIRAEIDRVAPQWIFSTALRDCHGDHRAVAMAVRRVVALRPEPIRLFEYETWAPVQANWVVDIAETIELKRQAVASYRLPLSCLDYAAAFEGMARYRAIHLPGGCGYAEAFAEVENDVLTDAY